MSSENPNIFETTNELAAALREIAQVIELSAEEIDQLTRSQQIRKLVQDILASTNRLRIITKDPAFKQKNTARGES